MYTYDISQIQFNHIQSISHIIGVAPDRQKVMIAGVVIQNDDWGKAKSKIKQVCYQLISSSPCCTYIVHVAWQPKFNVQILYLPARTMVVSIKVAIITIPYMIYRCHELTLQDPDSCTVNTLYLYCMCISCG